MSSDRRLRVAPSDDVVDHVIRRGRNAGGAWIVASVVVFALGIVVGNPTFSGFAFVVGLACFSIGIAVRVRYWRRARSDLGDEAFQRGKWRDADREAEDPRRIIVALVLVALVITYRLWK
jgi:flagellar biosynthesis component FlhA